MKCVWKLFNYSIIFKFTKTPEVVGLATCSIICNSFYRTFLHRLILAENKCQYLKKEAGTFFVDNFFRGYEYREIWVQFRISLYVSLTYRAFRDTIIKVGEVGLPAFFLINFYRKRI